MSRTPEINHDDLRREATAIDLEHHPAMPTMRDSSTASSAATPRCRSDERLAPSSAWTGAAS